MTSPNNPTPAETGGGFSFTSAELFAGAGGLSMAVDRAFDATNIWFSEIDPAPCKVLAHRFPNVPNLGDVTKIDWATTPRPNVLGGGFPCTDVSLAGRMKGMNGTRSGLWTVFADSIEQLQPEWVVIENVRGLLSTAAQTDTGDGIECEWCEGDSTPLRAMGAVLLDLARLGYDAEWVGLRASDIGAPHSRFRVFIVAWKKQHTIPSMMPAPFATASQERGNWETSKVTLMCGHAELYGEAWPTSGALRDGNAYTRAPFEPGQYDKLLPTPNTMDMLPVREGEARERALHRGDLNGSRRTESSNLRERVVEDLAPLLRTPAAAEAGGGPRDRNRPGATMRLSDQIREEMDDGNIALLPTPVAQPSGNSPEEHLRKKPGRKVVTDLSIMAEHGLIETGGRLPPTPSAANAEGGQITRGGDRSNELLLGGIAEAAASRQLPTPVVNDMGDGKTVEWWDEWVAKKKEIHGNGNGHGPSLAIEALRTQNGQLLPTPEAKLGRSGPDYARMDRDGSGGDDLATTIAKNERDHTNWGPYEPAIRRAELAFGRPAPAPVKYDGKEGKPRLSAELPEWMMGHVAGWITDPAIGLSRNEQLRIIGNGVVPQQGEFAIRICLSRPGVPPLIPPQLAA